MRHVDARSMTGRSQCRRSRPRRRHRHATRHGRNVFDHCRPGTARGMLAEVRNAVWRLRWLTHRFLSYRISPHSVLPSRHC